MADFTIEKKNFDMQKLSIELSEYSKLHNIGSNDNTKLQLIIEEFLANILFPNFEGAAEISILNDNKELSLVFTYKGIDYMNKITDDNFLSLKILDKKTKEIKSCTSDGVTSVKFILNQG